MMKQRIIEKFAKQHNIHYEDLESFVLQIEYNAVRDYKHSLITDELNKKLNETN